MLYVINKGGTGRTPGCQRTILHLASTVATGIELGREWAISDGNAGASYAEFYAEISALGNLDWNAIRANDWEDQSTRRLKQAEFLVADSFPWSAIRQIGCHDLAVANQISSMLRNQQQAPLVEVRPEWYY